MFVPPTGVTLINDVVPLQAAEGAVNPPVTIPGGALVTRIVMEVQFVFPQGSSMIT